MSDQIWKLFFGPRRLPEHLSSLCLSPEQPFRASSMFSACADRSWLYASGLGIARAVMESSIIIEANEIFMVV
jgi:hypothetical protein